MWPSQRHVQGSPKSQTAGARDAAAPRRAAGGAPLQATFQHHVFHDEELLALARDPAAYLEEHPACPGEHVVATACALGAGGEEELSLLAEEAARRLDVADDREDVERPRIEGLEELVKSLGRDLKDGELRRGGLGEPLLVGARARQLAAQRGDRARVLRQLRPRRGRLLAASPAPPPGALQLLERGGQLLRPADRRPQLLLAAGRPLDADRALLRLTARSTRPPRTARRGAGHVIASPGLRRVVARVPSRARGLPRRGRRVHRLHAARRRRDRADRPAGGRATGLRLDGEDRRIECLWERVSLSAHAPTRDLHAFAE